MPASLPSHHSPRAAPIPERNPYRDGATVLIFHAASRCYIFLQYEEQSRLMTQLQVVWKLKQGIENRNSVVGCTVSTYSSILDSLINDVAVDLHRTLSLGLESLDSVQDRVAPNEANAVGPLTPAGKKATTPKGKGAKDMYGRAPQPALVVGRQCITECA